MKDKELTPSRQLSVKEYAAHYGVSTLTVYRLLQKRKIPNAIKIGSQWRIPANALEQTR